MSIDKLKLGILLFILSVVFFNCTKRSFNSDHDVKKKQVGSSCDSVNRFDSLVQDILRKEYIYALFDLNQTKFQYLISREFIKPGKTFLAKDTLPVFSIELDSVKNDNIGRIMFYDCIFNNDSSQVNLKVDYLANAKMHTKTSTFKYIFDFDICKWQLKDSSTFFFN